ncbi:MAG: methionyl-tRNA formyltransferase [Polaribacter sp.]|jgi:methionyl-tRNA formyltransferase
MKKINVAYCGNVAKVADEIFLSDYFTLQKVFVEKNKVNSDILTFCCLREVELEIVENKKDLELLVRNVPKLDCLIVCGFGIIISQSLIDFIPAYNFHPGKLPNYKGRHPTFFATINGEPTIDITLHKIASGIDEGDIIKILPIKYRFGENEADLTIKLPQAIEVMLPILFDYIKGNTLSYPNIGGKYYPPVTLKNKTFTVDNKPSKILRIIKAQAIYDGGLFSHEGITYKTSSGKIDLLKKEYNIFERLVYFEKNIIGIAIDDSFFLRLYFNKKS